MLLCVKADLGFLITPKDKWIKKSTTNVYYNLNALPDIVKVLKKVGQLKEFRSTSIRRYVDASYLFLGMGNQKRPPV